MVPLSSAPVPDRGTSLIIMMWVLTIVSSITIVMRLAIHVKRAIIGWDDLFMLLSMICFYGWTITLTLLCLKGGERHIWHVALLGQNVITEVQLLNWTCQIFGIIGVGAGKVSISALLLAIMQSSHRAWQKTYLWTFCIILVCCVSISCSILTFAQCRPAAALWDSRVKGACINPKIMADFGTFTGAYNTFVDASLALIPSTIFWSLRMEFHEKITLSIVFALNVLTSICSGIKTSYLSQLANRTDFTWATFDIFAWVTAEFFLITVCGSIPTLKPILNICLRRSEPKSPEKYEDQEFRDFALNGFRNDGARSETRITTGDKDVLVETTNEVKVEKSYQITIRRSDEKLDDKDGEL